MNLLDIFIKLFNLNSMHQLGSKQSENEPKNEFKIGKIGPKHIMKIQLQHLMIFPLQTLQFKIQILEVINFFVLVLMQNLLKTLKFLHFPI